MVFGRFYCSQMLGFKCVFDFFVLQKRKEEKPRKTHKA